MRPGQVEPQTYDYKRNGTTTLFAALEIATGKVLDACKPRHRHQEFLAFPQAGRQGLPTGGRQLRHPQAPQGQRLAGPQPRVHLHFTPTSCS